MSETYGIGHAKAKYQAAKDAATQEAEMSDPQPTMAAVLAQMAALIEKIADTGKSDVEQAAALKQIELMEQLVVKTRPENIDHPHKSAYSFPEGDIALPRPDLKCKILWVGYELSKDTLTPQEIELLNRIMPGEYRVTKADGTGIPFRVSAKQSDKLGPDGKPTIAELSIWFPCKGDQRQSHMSMVSYLEQALGDKLPTVAEMTLQLAQLKRELEAAQTGVTGRV